MKVKLTVQKEVALGAVLQQTFIVEFTIFNQICDDCQRIEAKDYWKALVQVRQRVRLSLSRLVKVGWSRLLDIAQEDVLLSRTTSFETQRSHTDASNIKQVNGGLDFYFAEQNCARKLVDFLMCVVPCR